MLALTVRLGPEHDVGGDLARLPAGLGEREQVGAADLDLVLAPALVGIPKAVGLAPRGPDFQQEAGVRVSK